MAKNTFSKCTGYGTLVKSLIWHSALRHEVRTFPEEARGKIGYLLYLLQKGDELKMPHSKSMSSIAKGVYELRVGSKEGIFRVFYYLKFENGILIFHAMQKKTEKTSLADLRLAKKRLNELLESLTSG